MTIRLTVHEIHIYSRQEKEWTKPALPSLTLSLTGLLPRVQRMRDWAPVIFFPRSRAQPPSKNQNGGLFKAFQGAHVVFCFALFRSFLIVYTSHALNYFYKSITTCRSRGVTALTRAVSGEKQIYSGNLEILPGIGKPGKFFGKYEIFSGHWAKIWYYMLSNNIYTVICTQCMRCILCILTLENGWTPHDMKRPISNVSN